MKYKMTIQYDGSYFSGWQIQDTQCTVQGLIESILQKISKNSERIIIYGAGRTDTGVHAWGQIAHVELNMNLQTYELQNALNGNLPKYCRIMKIEKVPKDFHSRFDAKSRQYLYQCYTGSSILNDNQAWILPSIDLNLLNGLAKYCIGLNNFLSFSKYSKDKKNTNCLVYEAYWLKNHQMSTFYIKANRYLHHMIRYLVGSMIGVQQGRMSEAEFKALLDKPKKDVKIFRAPSRGLILEKINYE
ncbi:MAG: tRNA pseudouridine(38-40) synthase TruA [Candidatus Marinimicrobia bacterium]|nr:tRNA pseudouridine(38-40) synthase TruA [Candidatus Neomarinimicrobiota bacterium]